MADTLKRWMAQGAVRIQTVELDRVWQRMCERHNYPPAIQSFLGELAGAAALLSANIKFNGALVLQLQGDGPVGLTLVECHADLGMRAMVKLRESHALPANPSLQQLVNENGQGRFAIILDPRDRLPGQQPYQGVVSLAGDSVAQLLESYMAQSEQLETRLFLAANANCVRGLLLQKLPMQGGLAPSDPDLWDRLLHLAGTLGQEELLSLDGDTLVHRLFWQEQAQLLDEQRTSYRCSCSREKLAGVIRMLGSDEAHDILREQGSITLRCDFCAIDERFDAVDVEALFHPAGSVKPDSDLRH